jgi:hypothetical protein
MARKSYKLPGNQELGSDLKEAREKGKVKPADIAKLLGRSSRTLTWKIETGQEGLSEEDWKKAFTFIWARREFGPPILEIPNTRPTLTDLQRWYSAETRWIGADFGVACIAAYAHEDGTPVFLTSDEVKYESLNQSKFQSATLSEALYEKILGSYVQLFPNNRIFEGTKARLIRAEYHGDAQGMDPKLILGYSRAKYADTLITHQLLDYLLKDTPDLPLTAPTPLRTLLIPEGERLPPLDLNSPVANTVGRGGLVFTRDDHLLLVRRSARVAVDQNLYDIPVQGSSDIKTNETAYDVFSDYKQEAQDELLIEDDKWEQPRGNDAGIYLMALIRNASIGGKPDFLFIGKTKHDVHHIQRRAPLAEHAWERMFVTALPPNTTVAELLKQRADIRYTRAWRASISILTAWAHANALSQKNTIADISRKLFG